MKTLLREITVTIVNPYSFEMILMIPERTDVNGEIWKAITYLIKKWYSQNKYYALYKDSWHYGNNKVRIFSAENHLATVTTNRIDFDQESKNVTFLSCGTDSVTDQILKLSREFLYELKLKLNKECNFNMTEDYEDIDLAIEKFTTARLYWITDLEDVVEINKQRRSKML